MMEQISIQELSNRMAERSNDIIKFLFNMKVIATINHIIDKDTAEYIVKEFGHKPVVEEVPALKIDKKNIQSVKGTKKKSSNSYNYGSRRSWKNIFTRLY